MNQVILNALVSAAAYLLVGLGFSLIYTTARFFHFAHGIILTLSAYVAFAFAVRLGAPMPAALLGGVLAGAVAGVLSEVLLYRPMRTRGASPSTLLLASMGVYVSVQALLTLIFGSGTHTLRGGQLPATVHLVGGYLTMSQLVLIGAAVSLSALLCLFLYGTNTGRAMRAVSDDCDLARVYGIAVDRVLLAAMALGSLLAGVAGVLIAIDSDLYPGMGFYALVMGMVAVIVGGVRNPLGISLGALLIGVLQHLSAWWMSSRWQDVAVFLLLITFLLVRPHGFLGRPPRSSTV